MKIVTIIGARPQFIKAAAVSRAIAGRNMGSVPNFPIEEILIHTGQHYDDGMSAVFFRELEIPEPKYNLNIGSGPHGAQTGRMLAAIEEVLVKEEPDWVLIYGDTNSTLAGALAAAKLHISIAHVEAGLRSFNRRMPEEINRVVADQLSQLLLCPSETAVKNLAAEGIPLPITHNPLPITHNPLPITHNPLPITSRVLLVGDVMADALQFAAAKSEAQSGILSRLGLKPQGYLLATVHRAENTDDSARFDSILSAFGALHETVVFPVHPRTRKLLQKIGYEPPPNVKLIDPVGYFDIIALEKSARMILTDSGGMQKEAYWLKVPCVTLRDETEWVETVEAGWNILAGADRTRIIEAVSTFNAPSNHPPLYGDGKAALHCLEALLD
jgi:UDP-GlcNAc3NAcA epimerase